MSTLKLERLLRYSLFVLGRAESLCVNPDWSALIEMARYRLTRKPALRRPSASLPRLSRMRVAWSSP